eukprot:6207331-Pleurochrysis_carterae.AAC.1
MQEFANTLEQSVSSDSLHDHIQQQHFYQYLDAGQRKTIRDTLHGIQYPQADSIRALPREQRASLFGAAAYAFAENGSSAAQEFIDTQSAPGMFAVDTRLSNTQVLVVYEVEDPEVAHIAVRG